MLIAPPLLLTTLPEKSDAVTVPPAVRYAPPPLLARLPRKVLPLTERSLAVYTPAPLLARLLRKSVFETVVPGVLTAMLIAPPLLVAVLASKMTPDPTTLLLMPALRTSAPPFVPVLP